MKTHFLYESNRIISFIWKTTFGDLLRILWTTLLLVIVELFHDGSDSDKKPEITDLSVSIQ